MDFIELLGDMDDSNRSILLEVFDSSTITFIFGNTDKIQEVMEFAHKVNAYAIAIVPSRKEINAEYCSILLAEPFGTQEKGCQPQIFDEIIYFVVKSIYDTLNVPGMINLEANDIIQAIGNKGFSYVVTGIGNSPVVAVEEAINEYHEIRLATKCLVNITGRLDYMTMERAYEAMLATRKIVGDKTEVVLGASIDDSMDANTFRVVVIGIGEKSI